MRLSVYAGIGLLQGIIDDLYWFKRLDIDLETMLILLFYCETISYTIEIIDFE
jgi:hypothetical protein